MAVSFKSIVGGVMTLLQGALSNTGGQDVNAENIFDAAREGHLKVVRNLVENGSNVNVANDNGDNPLHWAALNGHLEIVKYLVEKGADFNIKNKSGNTPLHWCARSGRLSIVKYLVEKGADFRAKNNEDFTSLQEAARNGHLSVVRYLVDEKNADINGEKSIHAAAQGGSLDVVKYLVDEKHANVNVQNPDGNTPLHDAAREGHLGVVKYLVRKGADVNTRNIAGNTPLNEAISFHSASDVIQYLGEEEEKNYMFNAAKSGNLDSVKYFVENRRVDVNTKDSNGDYSVHWAAYNGHLEIVKYLVEKGADFDIRNKRGNTPLDWSAQGGTLDVAKYLVDEKHADVNNINIDRNTPLHDAARAGHLALVEYLVRKGADLYIRNNAGNTPQKEAIAFSSGKDVIQYLREEERKINIFDAARRGNLYSVKHFVEYEKVSANTKDSDGDTPLHKASLSGNLDVVRYLVEKGADLNVTDKNGRTPVQLAEAYGKTDIVNYLREVGGRRIRRSIKSIDFSNEVNMIKKHEVKTENMALDSDKVGANTWINEKVKETTGGSYSYKQKKYLGHNNRYKRHMKHSDVNNTFSESISSSGARSSSWINTFFGWIKNSVGRLTSMPEGISNTGSISQVDGRIDVNGVIMVLDLLIRKITGKNYMSAVDQSISLLEAQSYALNVIEKFVNVMDKTATKSGISVMNLNFDSVKAQLTISEQMINGRFSEISKTLYSSAKHACPEIEQTGKFLAFLKSNLEEILSREEIIQLRQKAEQISDQQFSRKVMGTELSKKTDILNRTSVIKNINNVTGLWIHENDVICNNLISSK